MNTSTALRLRGMGRGARAGGEDDGPGSALGGGELCVRGGRCEGMGGSGRGFEGAGAEDVVVDVLGPL